MRQTRAGLEAAWTAQGISPDALTLASDGTIAVADEPSRWENSDTLFATDPEASAAELPLSEERLVMGERLGQGAMGEVRAAEQPSLRREVAVKTLLDPSRKRALRALFEEAWVAGAIAHPNVVPVHTLARVEGGPAVVMKRIEGESLAAWSSARAELSVVERLEAARPLFNKVCHAVAHAHALGVLHLDLKPENVMIGAFGEVYVVDWGLARGFGPDRPAWLPPAEAIRSIAGTPAYMAPESVAADGSRVGPATDVYLLGAMLHELLTGSPPHLGSNLQQVLIRAFESAPFEYDAEVPAELGAIAARAMAADPAERFGSVTELRDAVEAQATHALASRFVARAESILDELEVGIAEGDGDDATLEPLFSGAEQALRRAARRWDAHPGLEVATERLARLRFEHALLGERLETAEILLGRMRSPSAEARARLEALRRALEARKRRVRGLEAMSREIDLALGSRDRRRVFAGLGLFWALASFSLGWLDRSGLLAVGYPLLLAEGAGIVLVLGPYGWIRRRSLFRNRANRRFYGGLIFTASAVQLFWVASLLLGLPVQQSLALTPLIYAYAFATLALVFDPRLFAGAAALAASAVATALAPSFVHEWIGLGGGFAVLFTLLAWRRRD